MFPSIAAMFRNVVQTAPANPMAQNNPGAAAVVPAAGTSNPITPTPEANPLDTMKALWQTDPNSAPSVDPLATPLFNSDPAKIAAAASKIDLVSQIPADLMAKAMSGQDPAAFAQVLNAVAQRTLATSTQLNAATVEQAAATNNQRMLQALPGKVRQIQLDGMQPDNPLLQHEAAQPFLNMVRSQLASKNPGMSAVEINRQAESIVTGFAGAISPAATAQQPSQPANGGGTDWDTWAST